VTQGAARTRCRRFRPSGLLALALLASAGCAPPGSGGTGDRVAPARLTSPYASGLYVGCWAMTWSLRGAAPGDGAPELPDSISLRTGAVFGTTERLVSPATHPTARVRADGAVGGAAPWESVYRLNRWWVEDEALHLRFSDGGEDAWLVRLREADGVLEGEGWRAARAEPGERPGASVRAARIGCDFG